MTRRIMTKSHARFVRLFGLMILARRRDGSKGRASALTITVHAKERRCALILTMHRHLA